MDELETKNETQSIEAINAKIQQESQFLDQLNAEISKVIIGQQYMIDRLLIGLLANGHILLEGVPGLAKTLAIKTLSEAIGGNFNRVQFTPDLLPADIVGTMIYSQRDEEFTVKKGPVFANFVLADEINRAPAKVQSALLEAMQERHITLGQTTYELPKPFLVMATQNPVEQEGTYPLPEAQVDRFMLKVYLDYPTKEEEQQIIRHNISSKGFPKAKPVVTIDQIRKAKELVKEIYLDEKIEKYIVDLVYATRTPEAYGLDGLKHLIGFGASPRASINMALAAKAYAFLNKRGFVIPEDVRAVCPDVLRHRIGLTYEAEAEDITQADIVKKIMDFVEVP
ncbi:AAA family ATPase [Crocinitomix algicola]|uniref:AAA family ATPase n=1 Tax=Crocinitomix algicola TaxID=1740263 RepID=UPI000837545C|nr:MoxR family ATPase [Crocinitomix algicola]